MSPKKFSWYFMNIIGFFFQTHKLCENLLKKRFQGLHFFRILRINYIKTPLTVFICLHLHHPAFVTHVSDFPEKAPLGNLVNISRNAADTDLALNFSAPVLTSRSYILCVSFPSITALFIVLINMVRIQWIIRLFEMQISSEAQRTQ